MLWSQARVQHDTKDNRIIFNLNRPAKMFSSSLFTLVVKFKKERRFDEVLAITAVSPFLGSSKELAMAMRFQEPITWSEQLLRTRVMEF